MVEGVAHTSKVREPELMMDVLILSAGTVDATTDERLVINTFFCKFESYCTTAFLDMIKLIFWFGFVVLSS